MLTSLALRIVERVPPRYQNTAKQFLKFGITGTLGATVDFGSYNILTRGFSWETTVTWFGLEFILANFVSVALAIFTMFLINKHWTFRNSSGRVVQQGIGYFTLNSITFILNQILTSFFAFQVPIIAAIFGSQKDNIAKALAVGFILFVNFLGSKFLVFKKEEPQVVASKSP